MNQRWPIRRGRSSGLGSPNARLPRLGTTAIAVNCGPPLSSIPSSGLLFRSLNIPHSFPTSMELELAPKANRIEADQRQLQLWWCCCWFLLPLIFIVVRIWNRKRSTNILWVSLGLGSTFLLVPLDSGHCIPGVLNQVQVVHGYAHCSRFFFLGLFVTIFLKWWGVIIAGLGNAQTWPTYRASELWHNNKPDLKRISLSFI